MKNTARVLGKEQVGVWGLPELLGEVSLWMSFYVMKVLAKL